MFKYFSITADSDVGELKKQFREQAKIHHPDFGGNEENFKAMMDEYELALKEIGKIKGKTYKMDFEFCDIVLDLLRLNIEGIEIEQCGWFVYVWGVPKPMKNLLNSKGLGLTWRNKTWKNYTGCWVWKPSWYTKRNKGSWDMEKIRENYGSAIARKREREEREMLTA